MGKYGKKIIWALLALYIASIFYLMVLGRTIADKGYNLELFWELKEFLSGNTYFGKQILRNILVFMPIGFLAYYASQNKKNIIIIRSNNISNN